MSELDGDSPNTVYDPFKGDRNIMDPPSSTFQLEGLLIVAGIAAPQSFSGTVFKPEFFEAPGFIGRARKKNYDALNGMAIRRHWSWLGVLCELSPDEVPREMILALNDAEETEQFMEQGGMTENIRAILSPMGATSHGAVVTREYANQPSFPKKLVIIGHTDVSQLASGDIMSVEVASNGDVTQEVTRY